MHRLLDITKTNKNGTTALNIVNALKQLGFESYGVKISDKSINKKDINLPCIAHVIINHSYMHYVVIYDINFKKRTMKIADPADKIKTLTINDFKKDWTGHLIFAHPLKKIQKEKKANLLSLIFKIFKENKTIALNIFLISFLTTLYGLASVFQIRSILDNYQEEILLNLIIFFILLFFIKNILEFYRFKILIYFKKIVDETLTVKAFENIIELPYQYYKNHTSGEISSKINDIENIKNFISKVFLTFFIDIILVIISFSILYQISNELTYILILTFVLYIVIIKLFKKVLKDKIDSYHEEKAIVNSKMIESINLFETIKSLNIENKIKSNFIKIYKNYLNKVSSLESSFLNQNTFKNLIDDYAFLFILLIGTLLLKDNKIKMLDIVLFTSMFYYFQGPLKNILDLDFGYKEAEDSLNKISYFQIEKKEGIKKVNNINSIKLNQLNETINKGDKVIIKGSSGVGKTTLLNKIYKNIESKQKEILINDECINNLEEKSLKDNITYVSQNEKLFSDTILNNIVCQRYNLKGNVKDVIDLCLINPIVSNKKMGLNYLIEEDSFNLSGGEMQKIVLARALLNAKDIIMIDEGFSKLDIKTEMEILKNIFNKYKDKTIIVITHRNIEESLFNKRIVL